MNTQVSKIELIEMLLKENNQSSLLSIKKILQNDLERESDVIKIKKLLLKSEQQFQNGEGIDYETILNESESKYFSK